MATHAPSPTPPLALGRERPVEDAASATRKLQPVHYWGIAGGLLVAFMAFILVKWVTGENFERVQPGPTDAPSWQGPAQTVFQAALITAVLITGFFMIVRPWVRERRMTTDGALFIAFLTMFFQDQFTNFGGYWFTYNAHVFNMGSWFPEIPGWEAYAGPGQTAGEPIFMMSAGYIYFFLVSMFAGLALMRKLKAVRPGIKNWQLLASVWAMMAVVDFVIEVFIWIPMGFYTYTWAPGPMVNAGSDHQFPLLEAFAVGFLSMVIVALRFYTDDKGHTIVERGLEKVRTSPGKKALLRLLAMIAAIQAIFFFAYNVPMYQVGAHTKDWPEKTQQLSYFTNGICGADTPRACPTKTLPETRDDDRAVSVTPAGGLATGDGRQLAPDGTVPGVKLVPFVEKRP